MKWLGRNTCSIGSIHLHSSIFQLGTNFWQCSPAPPWDFGKSVYVYMISSPPPFHWKFHSQDDSLVSCRYFLAWFLMLNSYTDEKTQSHEPTTNYQATENTTQNRQLTSVPFHRKFMAFFNQPRACHVPPPRNSQPYSGVIFWPAIKPL